VVSGTDGQYGGRVPLVHDFQKKLEFSNGDNAVCDIERIKSSLYGCIAVEKTDIETDKTGVDYLAHLNVKGKDGTPGGAVGATVGVDAKRREKGASKWWNGEPELAIETVSVVENEKIGWTFNSKCPVDYILYSFDKEDSDKYYFIPFQLLRKAAWTHGREWIGKYKEKEQKSDGWTSKCVFVPASVVLKAVCELMESKADEAMEAVMKDAPFWLK